MFYIEGLTPGPGTLLQAETVLNTNLTPSVVFGGGHPSSPLLVVDDIFPEPWKNSDTQARVTVTYHPYSIINQPVITLTSQSRVMTSSYDYQGNPIVVTYTPPAAGGAAGTPIKTIGQVSWDKTFAILEIDRIEYPDPTSKLAYQDVLNSDFYFGQKPGTWKMKTIKIKRVFFSAGFQVSYLLEYDPKTHIKTAVYRDQFSGFIPKDVNTNPDPTKQTGNGWTNVQMNNALPFSALQLPNSLLG